MEVDEKRCQMCGRVGKRDFDQVIPGGPEWMGPWQCKWTGPCWRRHSANQAARETSNAATEQITPVDLDALQDDVRELS